MKRRCIGCQRVISSGSRCRACQPPKARGGSTRAWRNLRAQILARDQERCRYCGAPATHVDHIAPVSRGGGDHEGNLVAACVRCNLEKAARSF